MNNCIKYFYGNPPADIDNPEWKVKSISPNGIIVTYEVKYGPTYSVECIGLWYSEKLRKYRLTWKDAKFAELEDSNIVKISAENKK